MLNLKYAPSTFSAWQLFYFAFEIVINLRNVFMTPSIGAFMRCFVQLEIEVDAK